MPTVNPLIPIESFAMAIGHWQESVKDVILPRSQRWQQTWLYHRSQAYKSTKSNNGINQPTLVPRRPTVEGLLKKGAGNVSSEKWYPEKTPRRPREERRGSKGSQWHAKEGGSLLGNCWDHVGLIGSIGKLCAVERPVRKNTRTAGEGLVSRYHLQKRL